MNWLKKLILIRGITSGIRSLILLSQGWIAGLKLENVDVSTLNQFFQSAEVVLPQIGAAVAVLAWSMVEEYLKNKVIKK